MMEVWHAAQRVKERPNREVSKASPGDKFFAGEEGEMKHNAENPAKCRIGCPVCKKEGLAGKSKSHLVNAWWKRKTK